MAKRFKIRSIRFKILSIIFLSTFFIASGLGYMSFEFSKNRLVSMLGDVIKGIAATTANSISKEDMLLILRNAERMRELNLVANSAAFSRIYADTPAGEGKDETLKQAILSYKKYTDLLGKIKAANKIDSPINVYIRDGDSLKLILTSDRVILAGVKYQMVAGANKAFAANSPQSTGIYKDKDGIWISAYAPISSGAADKTQLVVEVSYKIDSYVDKLNKELLAILLVCLVGFIATAFVSYKLISRLILAIEELDEMARHLESEKYDISIAIKSEDEIGHLAHTFEKLRLSIIRKIDELRLSIIREKRAHLESIVAVTNAIELRDPYTGQHLYRVEKYALLIAKAMHIPHKKIEKLVYGCYLHDVGKIGISDVILQQPNLSKEEWEQVKKHSEKGAKIVEGVQFLAEVREIILCHQERYDGKGYPRGLKGEEIPLLARIVAVADAFDAMSTDRPYKEKVGFKEAMGQIEANAGTQFDPNVCNALMRYRDKIEKFAEKHFNRIMKRV